MKSFLLFLLLGFSGTSLFAQYPLFTIQEMKQLVNCPDHACFRKMVRAKGYTFSEQETTTVEGTTVTMYVYRILSTGQQPYYPEHLVVYNDKGTPGKSIAFMTMSQAFPSQLDAEIAQLRFKRASKLKADGTQEYTQAEDEMVWLLSRSKPGISRGTTTYTVHLDKYAKAVAQSILPADEPEGSTLDEAPHLGGTWDNNYPARNVNELFQAERAYAADYERQHGKVGHTFSRVEKVRIQGVYMGQYRTLTDRRWNDEFVVALHNSDLSGFANRRADLYRQEVLFKFGNEAVWMPIQEPLISSLKKEAKIRQTVTLYAVLVSYHDFGGNLHLSFLMNEFAAPKNASITSESTPVKAPLPQKNTSGQLNQLNYATKTQFSGAKSPEALAQLLLQALKNNDKSVWLRHRHPEREDEELLGQKFDRHRECLTAQGITNWASVQYSRLTYPLRPTGGTKVDPNKTIPFSTVEFTYQNGDFIGTISMGTFSLYEGKWLIWFSGEPERCHVMRQPRR